MKIIFLDLDGVLNNRSTFPKWVAWVKTSEGQGHSPMEAMDNELVNRLNTLVEKAGNDTFIVLSSTWRIYYSLEWMQDKLKFHGFRHSDRLIDKTPRLRNAERGEEICDWLANHTSIKQFVVLDDMDDMDGVHHRFVQTDDSFGLTDLDVEKALELLNKEN